MGRAAVRVDVQAVGLDADCADLCAQFIEGGRGDLVAGAVGAIDGDPQALQAQALGEAGLGDLDIAGLGVIDALHPAKAIGCANEGQASLKVVADHPLTDDDRTWLVSTIQKNTGYPFDIAIEQIDGELPKGPNGKLHTFMCMV